MDSLHVVPTGTGTGDLSTYGTYHS